MDTTTIVVLGIIILAVIVIGLVMASRGRMRVPALKALPPESRDRYVTQWDKIESRFVDSPDDAVREADALLLALLGEREHPLAEDKLPANMRRARREAVGQEGNRRAWRDEGSAGDRLLAKGVTRRASHVSFRWRCRYGFSDTDR